MIRIRILGSAAGGGLPQWNCACANCRDARAGRIPRATQSSVALSGNGRDWLLVNASPDLPVQLEAFSPLQPTADSPRNSPIAAVCLTSADIDHALGLVLMRQESSLAVYASPAIRDELSWIDNLLARFCQIDWREPPREFAPIMADVDLRAIPCVPSLAYVIRDAITHKQALIAPALRDLTDELRHALQTAHVILFDGTFWSEDELKSFRAGARTSREMGHIPVEESLSLLRSAPAPHKIYMHINNTNPMLQPQSKERRQVEAAGVIVGYDGLELQL